MRTAARPLLALGTALSTALATAAASSPAGAAEPRAGGPGAVPRPVAVSGPSPFAACTLDPGTDQIALNAEVEPELSVDPRDDRHMVAVWQQDRRSSSNSRGVVAAVTRDGGRTWRRDVVGGLSLCSGGGQDKAGGPWVSFAPNGDVYVSATTRTYASDESAVEVARSTDGGRSWGKPVKVAADTAGVYWHDKPSITADPGDPRRVYAIWNRRTVHQDQHDVMLARSLDGGRSWLPAKAVYRSERPDQGTLGNQIVVLPNGSLVNVFLENEFPIGGPPWPPADLPEQVRAIRSGDHGATWSRAAVISEHRLNKPVLPDAGTPVDASGIIPDVAVDRRTGALYAVWAQTGISTSDSAVALSASADGGRTWSTPRRIDHAPESAKGGNGQAFLPQVDVADNGTVAVTYYDFRANTPAAGTPTTFSMATCRGASCASDPARWRERRIAGPFDIENAVKWNGPFIGGYYGLTHTRNSFVTAFVMANSDADDKQDIYFARTPASPGVRH
ncbi:sialidase family protein [Actinomadura rupiterrae]|uniref:sialidase family protein n=1 Tax=Actinomadura rupiterrae TaxID=559627 RepID=UPI0020A5181C|nr:sialidase family protein [Actinomadura rupiterrae]MCP2341054.1 hypothetical protein [Actinomadura rupiterrae]